MRFQALAIRCSSVSSLLETGLTCDMEFKLLHSLMTNYSAHFGCWVAPEWHSRYNRQAAALRSLDVLDFSAEQKQNTVRSVIRALMSHMRSIDAMKHDEVNLLPSGNSDARIPNSRRIPAINNPPVSNAPVPSGYAPYRVPAMSASVAPVFTPGPPSGPPAGPAPPQLRNRFHVSPINYESARKYLGKDTLEMDQRFATK